jgi:hypothetical protein
VVGVVALSAPLAGVSAERMDACDRARVAFCYGGSRHGSYDVHTDGSQGYVQSAARVLSRDGARLAILGYEGDCFFAFLVCNTMTRERGFPESDERASQWGGIDGLGLTGVDLRKYPARPGPCVDPFAKCIEDSHRWLLTDDKVAQEIASLIGPKAQP